MAKLMVYEGIVSEFSIRKARRVQTLLAQKVITEDRLPREIRLVAGVDAAYSGSLAFGAAAVLNYKSFAISETQSVVQNVRFPYVSSFLSFRELPVAVKCIRMLRLHPDVLLVDGHGKAHPYQLGLASHIGLVLGMPTVGVAKRELINQHERIGKDTFVVQHGEIVGAVLPIQGYGKPIYVSIGHMISLETALKVVKHCIRGARIPEPIRVAHSVATKERKLKRAPISNTENMGIPSVECKTERNC
jgi:deoxyribonuclease V